MKHQYAIAMVAGTLAGLSTVAVPCAAQTPSVPPGMQFQPPQFQLPQNPPAALPPLPPSGGGFTTINPATTAMPAAAAGSTLSSSSGKSFGTVSRGLPGMPGGPPLNSSPGAQDPSSKFMRPAVIGPLFCDPAIRIPC